MNPQEYFVYFKDSMVKPWIKRSDSLRTRCFQKTSPIKRVRGE